MNNKTKQNGPDCNDTAPLNFLCLSLATSPFHLKAAAKLAKIESMTVNVIFLAQNSVHCNCHQYDQYLGYQLFLSFFWLYILGPTHLIACLFN